MANTGSALGFTTLDQELTEIELHRHGQIPEWLEGDLLRTGPAQFEVGKVPYRHWFDGLAMLYRFHFQGGRVVYSNRYLQSDAYLQAKATGAPHSSEFATNPRPTLLQRLRLVARAGTGANANVNTSRIGTQTVALTETPHPVAFDPVSLATLDSHTLPPSLPGQITTAHPHFDARRQCQYNYLLEFGRVSKYRLYRIDTGSTEAQHVATVITQRPAYMHSFGMSERYLVLTEFPLVTNPLRFLLRNRPFIQNYRWEPERGTLFHVIDKDTGQILKTARAEPFFAFHHVNAFEQDGKLCVDIIAFPDASVIDELYLKHLRSEAPTKAAGKLIRFTIDLDSDAAVMSRTLANAVVELPRFDYRRRAGQHYRYVYAAGTSPNAAFIDKLIRIDLEAGKETAWSEADCYPGEPVFVPRPEGEDEDDGVVLAVVLDARAGRSFLIVLDAASWTEQARFELPHPVPFGFHGNFFVARNC
ncbi:carotenoid oxygenase family protein [Pseudomonas sp. FME51]|uniref:carotenoid oxygenase family protein n=1 Tax=Pseudomonas sp. FME51 TaxID=2742609 RepID=UPI00186877C1|nr:carotenoid oxygenase family protein [Pseudomonas sp. FME51]